MMCFSYRILSITAVIATFMLAHHAQANKWVSPQELARSQYATASQSNQTQATQYKGRYSITAHDVSQAAQRALTSQNVAEHVETTVNTTNGQHILYQHNQPLSVKLHALSVSQAANAWQAQAYLLSRGQTIAVIPVSGRYNILQRVPVLSKNMDSNDIIEASDISYIEMSEQRLNKNTILSETGLIGLSPKGRISPNRPIRANEIIRPKMVEKHEQVELVYTSDFISIRGVGKALETGSKGDLIRVKNADSGRAVTARIVGPNKAEVNLSRAL